MQINKFEEIRKILLKDWDPIGIGDDDCAYDEYDMYIPTIYKLVTNEDLETFIEYIRYVQGERMCLDLFERERYEVLYQKIRNEISTAVRQD